MQWQGTSGIERRMIWCRKYNRILEHGRICWSILKGGAVVEVRSILGGDEGAGSVYQVAPLRVLVTTTL